MYYRVTKETKKKIYRKKCKWTTESWTQTPPSTLYQQTTRQPELQSDEAGSDLRCSWVCCLKDGHRVLNRLEIDQRRSRSQEQSRLVTRGRGKVCLFHEEEEQQWRTMHAFLEGNPEENEVNVLNGLKSTLSFRTVRKLIVTVNKIYKCI